MIRRIQHTSTWMHLLLCFLTVSCKKDKDVLAPVIVFHAPYENQGFTVFDTIPVNAAVNDDTHIQFVSINLLNEQFIPVQASITVPVNAVNTVLSQPYIIYEAQLPSGNYFLQLIAFDGNNESKAYRKIHITEVPLRRKGIYLLAQSTSGAVDVLKVDTAFAVSPQLSLSGDYSGSAINSYYGHLYIAGAYNGNFKAIDLETNTVKWSLASVPGFFPYFRSVYGAERTVYVAFNEEKIKGYDRYGKEKFTATGMTGYYPLKMILHEGRLISEQKEVAGTKRKLITYEATGVGKQETYIDQQVVYLAPKDANALFVFGNRETQAVMEIYDVQNNGLWSPHSLPAGKMLSAAQVDRDTYLIAHENNTIYTYRYSTNSLIPYLSGIAATQLCYDAVTGELIVAEVNKVSVFAYPAAALKHSLSHTDSIVNVQVLYNR